MRVALVVFLAGVVVCASQVQAQVRCTMPNGVVIEQKLSTQCPRGALKGVAADGSAAAVQGAVPPQPVLRDRNGRLSQRVLESEFGNAWPFTVSEGVLRCMTPLGDGSPVRALVLQTPRGTYALNGAASSHGANHGWESIDSIWRANYQIPGTKIPVSALIARAQALCV